MLKNIILGLTGIVLTVIGEYFAFRVYSNIEFDVIYGLLGIIAFLSIFIGCILFLTPIFKLWIKLDKQLNGAHPIHRSVINILAFFLSLIPFIVAGKVFYHFTGKYHSEQLKQHGIVTKVKIHSEIKGNNSRHDLCFDFMHNGKKWEGMLASWNYEVGDSAAIIYSAENPNEMEWYQLYLEQTSIHTP